MSGYPYPGNKRYNSYNEYFKRTFGGRVQKLSVNAGFTCPNRDGAVATGGCSFCDNEAFHPSYCQAVKPITQQLEEGKRFHAWRYRRSINYLAYFQAFSNTYAPVAVLRKLYGEALNVPGITGLVIGTRPDCIDDEILDLLEEKSRSCYLIVEFGVESVYDQTLKSVNRGHDFKAALQALEKTAARGIRCGAHFIFGLPGETREMMLNMAKVISTLPIDTVKFHQLQIVRGTRIEAEFKANPFSFYQFSLEDYVSFMAALLERLTPSVVVERFAGEVPPRFLVGNPWGLVRYDAIARMIETELEKRDTWQGKLYM